MTCTNTYTTIAYNKKNQPPFSGPPDHSAGWLWCAVAPVWILSLTEAYLRLIGAQHSLTLQCPRWHGNAREELGFKDVVIRIVRVSEAGTAVRETLFRLLGLAQFW